MAAHARRAEHPPRYDVFGHELPPGQGAGLKNVKEALSRVERSDPRQDWTREPMHRTQSQLLEERKQEQRSQYKARELDPDFRERLRRSTVFASDPTPRTATSYKRRAAPWEEISGENQGPPKHASQRELIESRQRERLAAGQAFAVPEETVDPQEVVKEQQRLARLREGYVEKPHAATKSEVEHARRLRARREGGLAETEDLFLGKAPAETLPQGTYPADRRRRTQSQLRHERRQAELDRGRRVMDEQRRKAVGAVLEEENRQVQHLRRQWTQEDTSAGAAAAGPAGKGLHDKAAPSWGGHTLVSPLAHMRTMAAEAERSLGRTRSSLQQERSRQFAKEAQRFQPKLPGTIHTDVAPSFDERDTPAGRGWWQTQAEQQRTAEATAAVGTPPALDVTQPPMARSPGDASDLLARRRAQREAPVTADPMRQRAADVVGVAEARRRAAAVAPKVSEVPPETLCAGMSRRQVPSEEAQKRWTDVVIEFQGSAFPALEAEVDERGKFLYYTAGERDPMYSSFATDGVFRYVPPGAGQRRARVPTRASPVGRHRSPALRGAGRAPTSSRSRAVTRTSSAGNSGGRGSAEAGVMAAAGFSAPITAATTQSLRPPGTRTLSQQGSAARKPDPRDVRGGRGQPALVVQFGDGGEGDRSASLSRRLPTSYGRTGATAQAVRDTLGATVRTSGFQLLQAVADA